jgi:hypothetical protein
MKTRKGFHLRKICGENIMVAEGIENIDFSQIISMNDSAAYLWKKVEDDHEFTVEDITNFLLEEYDTDEATARRDAERTVEDWKEAGLIVE